MDTLETLAGILHPECFPDPDICALCGGDAGSNGGGSRELYEQAKQIGEQRAEGSDD